MDYIHFIILGLIQGLTEFLPVSSSAHLILIPRILGTEDQGLAVDVAAHVGTLCAVIFYFRRDLRKMIHGWIAARCSLTDNRSRFVWYLIIATIPVAAAGLLAGGLIEVYLRNPLVIAGATILFGLLLWWADSSGRHMRTAADLGWKDVIIIGLFQAIALIPGTSRSGIAITAGLLLGLDRDSASRFSFLLSIPVIMLAGGYEAYKLATSVDRVEWIPVLIVAVVSAITAAVTIHFFLKFLQKTGLQPYIIYRLLLGVVLLYLFV